MYDAAMTICTQLGNFDFWGLIRPDFGWELNGFRYDHGLTMLYNKETYLDAIDTASVTFKFLEQTQSSD